MDVGSAAYGAAPRTEVMRGVGSVAELGDDWVIVLTFSVAHDEAGRQVAVGAGVEARGDWVGRSDISCSPLLVRGVVLLYSLRCGQVT